MSTQDIAQDLVGLWRQNRFEEAGETYWADDVVSVEAFGDEPDVRGKAQARAKGAAWNQTFRIDEVTVEGPYLHGDAFIVRFQMTTTNKASGEKASMDETALYRIKNGKIAEERFFYAA